MNDITLPPGDGGHDESNLVSFPSRVSLSRLDPQQQASRFEGTVRSIVAEVVEERARRRGRAAPDSSLLGALGAWSRPALAAASLVVVAAGLTLVFVPVPAAAAPLSLAEAVGIPAPLVEWAGTRYSPGAAEWVDAFQADVRVAADAPSRLK